MQPHPFPFPLKRGRGRTYVDSTFPSPLRGEGIGLRWLRSHAHEAARVRAGIGEFVSEFDAEGPSTGSGQAV